MERRSFFKRLAAGAIGLAIAPFVPRKVIEPVAKASVTGGWGPAVTATSGYIQAIGVEFSGKDPGWKRVDLRQFVNVQNVGTSVVSTEDPDIANFKRGNVRGGKADE